MEQRFIKITNAVYSVLDFFPSGDPLTTEIKQKALVIMESSTLLFTDSGWVSLKDCFSGNREKSKKQILEDLDILLNYLKLAKLRGWINGLNFLIIFNEYEKIKKEIKPKENSIFSAVEPELLFDSLDKIDKEQVLNVKKTDKATVFISERQKKIIKVLEKKGRAQVMDFKEVLGNITKRTIRRDLDELLKMGKITREGEFNQVFYKISD